MKYIPDLEEEKDESHSIVGEADASSVFSRIDRKDYESEGEKENEILSKDPDLVKVESA